MSSTGSQANREGMVRQDLAQEEDNRRLLEQICLEYPDPIRDRFDWGYVAEEIHPREVDEEERARIIKAIGQVFRDAMNEDESTN